MSNTTSAFVPPSTNADLILAWLRRARESQLAHYEMAGALSRRAHWLGGPVIAITAIVGTSVFASIAAEVIPLEAKLIVGAMSLLATTLSSLQTFFKFAERAAKHSAVGARFGAIRRELESLHASGEVNIDARYIATLREKLDRLAEEAPHVDIAVYRKVQRSIVA